MYCDSMKSRVDMQPRSFRRGLLISFSILTLIIGAMAGAQDVPSGFTIHVVQRDENMFRIGLRYNISVDELARLNGILDATSIQVGQRLLVPLVDGAPTVDQPVLPPVSVNSFGGQGIWHTVIAGETLFNIATQYGSNVGDVAAANSITDATLIFPGQQLLIPGIEPPKLEVALPPSLSSIALLPQVLVEGRSGEVVITTVAPVSLSGTFLGGQLQFMQAADPSVWVALFGIPVGTVSGNYPLDLNVLEGTGQTPIRIELPVSSGQFITERINVLDDRLALLQTDVDASEIEFVRSLMTRFTSTKHFVAPMGLPAAAAITSPFGSNRSYNNDALVRLHTGTDFAGAPGSPIFAPAAGQIVFAGALNIRGNATIIDHGWGVYSGYWHQTQQSVAVDSMVSAGQVIGTIGSTGRVTGPHLHWELWVNGVAVDPMQWVQQPFGS
jgi:murein DD-endopeptidase MepM/ murein hydrolase activator NlpD